jgi:hypothetical protein
VSGYSGTPQLKKLGIAKGTRLRVERRPPGWEFSEPPEEAEHVSGACDVLVAFVEAPAVLDNLAAWGADIRPNGAIWVAWPRKAAGHRSEVSENLIRNAALGLGLVDVKVAAIDQHWSGLKLLWRKELR